MTMRKATATLALIALATPALADNWKVSEGPSGSTQGRWTLQIQNGAASGQSQMTTVTNMPLGYKLTGTIQGQTYNFERTVSSDGARCSYKGQLSADGSKITGVAICGGSSTPWVAVIAPSTSGVASSN